MSAEFRNPMKTARGLGSAKTGTSHFIRQRSTAIALAFLAVYVLGLLIFCMTSDYAQAREVVKHPLNAIVLIAFVVSMLWHSKLGIQVVIEDYVHTPLAAMALQLLNIFVNAIAAIAGVLAIVRIALGA